MVILGQPLLQDVASVYVVAKLWKLLVLKPYHLPPVMIDQHAKLTTFFIL